MQRHPAAGLIWAWAPIPQSLRPAGNAGCRVALAFLWRAMKTVAVARDTTAWRACFRSADSGIRTSDWRPQLSRNEFRQSKLPAYRFSFMKAGSSQPRTVHPNNVWARSAAAFGLPEHSRVNGDDRGFREAERRTDARCPSTACYDTTSIACPACDRHGRYCVVAHHGQITRHVRFSRHPRLATLPTDLRKRCQCRCRARAGPRWSARKLYACMRRKSPL